MPQQQNPDGSWSDMEPIPFLGFGVDWEVYSDESPMRAVGYIGHISVAEVRSRSRLLLALKMHRGGRHERTTTQSTC